MRTTIDITEPLLRKAKAKAALEGKKLKDVVNEALEELLLSTPIFDEAKSELPRNARLDDIGRFRIPVLQSTRPGKARVSPKTLKELELNEDATLRQTEIVHDLSPRFKYLAPPRLGRAHTS